MYKQNQQTIAKENENWKIKRISSMFRRDSNEQFESKKEFLRSKDHDDLESLK